MLFGINEGDGKKKKKHRNFNLSLLVKPCNY